MKKNKKHKKTSPRIKRGPGSSPANLRPLTLRPKASVADQMGSVRDVSEVHCQCSVHRHQLETLLELLEILAQISSKKLQLGQERIPKARRLQSN